MIRGICAYTGRIGAISASYRQDRRSTHAATVRCIAFALYYGFMDKVREVHSSIAQGSKLHRVTISSSIPVRRLPQCCQFYHRLYGWKDWCWATIRPPLALPLGTPRFAVRLPASTFRERDPTGLLNPLQK
jgi:hypothetical protein